MNNSPQTRFYRDILDESGMSLYANSFPSKNSSPYIKKSLKIPGDAVSQSVKQLGRKSFEPEETLFSRRDMPDSVRQIKAQIDKSTDPDILERHRARWNASVDASKQYDKDLNSMKASMHKIRNGEYKLPALPMKERSPDLPHNDIGKDRGKYMGWQYGLEPQSEFKRKQIVDQITHTSQSMTKKMFDAIRYDYKSPLRQTIERNDEIREMKNDASKMRIEKSYRHDNPFVSEEKMNAGIFKELDNYHRTLKLSKKLQRSHPTIDTEAPFLIMSPQKSSGKLRCHHSGKWGQSPASGGKDTWSCCMNEYSDSQGCVKIPAKSVRWDNRPMFPL